jgi:ferredoxin
MIKKVYIIEEDCTSCGLCEDICPDIFQLDDVATIKENANIEKNEECIKDAVDSCPIQCIKTEE